MSKVEEERQVERVCKRERERERERERAQLKVGRTLGV